MKLLGIKTAILLNKAPMSILLYFPVIQILGINIGVLFAIKISQSNINNWVENHRRAHIIIQLCT